MLLRIKALEDRQKPSIASLKNAVTQYCLRPLSDFDKYKAVDMVEELANVSLQVKDKKADYYATVYSTLQERISKSAEQFKSYVLSLLGDREYEKVVESLAKVDKAFNQDTTSSPGPLVVPQSPQGFLPPSFPRELPSPPSYPSPYLYAAHSVPCVAHLNNSRYQGSGKGSCVFHCFVCGGSGHFMRHCPSRMGSSRGFPRRRMMRKNNSDGQQD